MEGSTTMTHEVRRAVPQDEPTITRLFAERFLLDPVNMWVFPDRADRERRHLLFFRPFVQLALARGHVDVVGDCDGAALWFDVVDTPPEPDVDRLQHACGPNWVRAAQVFALLDEHHPVKPHAYLLFIAARPGHGFGTALLTHRLADVDKSGQDAYLEASSPLSAALYRRLGYADLGAPIQPPAGPALIPMMRSPRH
jgi:ribosomal protein S18 acetylase RimI-like enzyme